MVEEFNGKKEKKNHIFGHAVLAFILDTAMKKIHLEIFQKKKKRRSKIRLKRLDFDCIGSWDLVDYI